MPDAPKRNKPLGFHVTQRTPWKPKTAGQAKARDIRNKARWKTFRAWFLRAHPLCCNPDSLHNDMERGADQVHHIVSLEEAPELAYTESNCAPLCTTCHARVEADGRKGRDTLERFVKWLVEMAREAR